MLFTKRGSISIETAIIALLAVAVLTVSLLFFNDIWGPGEEHTTITAEQYMWCGKYVQLDPNCKNPGYVQNKNSEITVQLSNVGERLGFTSCSSGITFNCVRQTCGTLCTDTTTVSTTPTPIKTLVFEDDFDTDQWTDGDGVFVDTAEERIEITVETCLNDDFASIEQEIPDDFELKFKYTQDSFDRTGVYFGVTSNANGPVNDVDGIFLRFRATNCPQREGFVFLTKLNNDVTYSNKYHCASLDTKYTIYIKKTRNTATVELWDEFEQDNYITDTLDLTGFPELTYIYAGGWYDDTAACGHTSTAYVESLELYEYDMTGIPTSTVASTSSTASTSTTTTITTTTLPGVILYEHDNWDGASARYVADDNSIPSHYSSIRVDPGMAAVLYSAPNWDGAYIVITSDVDDFTSSDICFDDVVDSIRVMQATSSSLPEAPTGCMNIGNPCEIGTIPGEYYILSNDNNPRYLKFTINTETEIRVSSVGACDKTLKIGTTSGGTDVCDKDTPTPGFQACTETFSAGTYYITSTCTTGCNVVGIYLTT